MRENCRAHDIVVAMDRIGPPNGGNRVWTLRGRIHGGLIEPIRQREPLTRWSELIAVRRGVTAVENGAEGKVAQIIRSDAGDVGLDDLSDFLLQRHPRQQSGDTRLERRIGSECWLYRRPAIRMYPGIGSAGRLMGGRGARRGGGGRRGPGGARGGADGGD